MSVLRIRRVGEKPCTVLRGLYCLLLCSRCLVQDRLPTENLQSRCFSWRDNPICRESAGLRLIRIGMVETDHRSIWSQMPGRRNILSIPWIQTANESCGKMCRSGTSVTRGLSAGIGAQSTGIGPEFQFGHCMGDDFEEPVSVIKTAWGGKTQAGDF